MWLIGLLIVLGLCFGVSLALGGLAAGSQALTIAGVTVLTGTASGALLTLTGTINKGEKYRSESMANNSFAHHNQREWKQLNKPIELDTLG